MKTSEFDYSLPRELIAQTPIEPRDTSRMLVVDRRTRELAHRQFRDLPEYLRPGDLLIGNNTRVIPARLRAAKPTGGLVELFLLRPASPSLQETSLRAPEGSHWECLVRGKGLHPGVRVLIDPPREGSHRPGLATSVTATIVAETSSGGRVVRFDPPVERWLWDVGQVPLPPYIHQPLADPERYQTVYGRIEGSVASSTAGLHFTPELLLELRQRGVHLAFVTLHIGLDTFRPVQTEDIEDHRMHREWAQLSADTARMINQTRLAGGRIVAVGTTVVRVLESAAEIALGFQSRDEVPINPCRGDSTAACGWRSVAAFDGETDLFIRPGHHFRVIDVLITNFHLPRSTLLMLVSAFADKALIERAYAEAILRRYRFYSFGDAMLIL